MNKTQKTAWFNLASALLCIALSIYLIIEILIFRRLPEGFGRWWPLVAFFCLFMGTSFIFLQRKQSAAEVDSDERDNLIKKRAVIVSFFSVWILLFAASIIPRFIVGEKGTIAVWLLPIINLGVLLIVMLVWSVAVLVQYGRGGNDGKQ